MAILALIALLGAIFLVPKLLIAETSNTKLDPISIITSTVGGSALGTSDYHFALLVFSLTLLISGIGWLIYRVICRKNEQTTQS